MMPNRLLFDTDVLIDYLRGRSEAIDYLEKCTEILMISVISVAELYAGVRQGKERKVLAGFLTAFEIVPLDQATAERGGLYRRDYGKSHNTGLADALIAAMAEIRQAQLITLNRKHFPMLKDVLVPYHKSGSA